MAQYNLGKVSIRPRGAYAANTNYEFLDSVQNLGGSWLALAASKGIQPGVTSGWENYWMLITKGIKSAVGSSPADGQTTITITFSDGSIATYTYDNMVLADGSVTRAKLAGDALHSPVKYINAGSESYTITAEDDGKTLETNALSRNFNINLENDPELPLGMEVAIYWLFASSVTITTSGGVAIKIPGEELMTNKTFSVPEKNTMIALKKVTTYNGLSYWALLGNVEVVS